MSPSPPQPFGAELRALFRLAAPIAVAQSGHALMGFVDTAVVGRVSATALAAVGLGNLLFFSISILGLGLLLGIDPLISQAFGRGDRRRCRQLYWQGVWLALGVSAVLAVPIALTPYLLGPLGFEESLLAESRRYIFWRLPSLLPMFLFASARAYLQAIGRPRPLVVATLAANVLNVGGDLLFVFGGQGLPGWTGPLQWVPAMGASGAAVSTTLCALLQVGVVAWAIGRAERPEHPAGLRRPVGRDLREALRVGLPVGLHFVAEIGVFALAGILAGRMGSESLGAHQVALAYGSVSFTLAVGIGSAGSVRVGWAIGSANTAQARRSGLTAFGGGVALMSLAALAFLLAPGPLARAVTDSPGVLELTLPLMAVLAAFQLSDGLQGVGAGVLRGAGDTRFVFLANVVGHWGVGLPITLALGLWLDWGVVGVWWGLCAGLTAVAAALVLRFLWLSARPIRPVEGHAIAGAQPEPYAAVP